MQATNRCITPLHARMGLALALAMAAQAACADTPTYCVNNDGDLVSALQLARTNALTVQLRQGTYHLNQTVWNLHLNSQLAKFHAGSSLLGGYTNATCMTRDIDVDNTILTDTTANPDDEISIDGDATIEGITFHLPRGLSVFALPSLPAGSLLTIRRSVFTQTINSTPLSIAWDADPAVGGTVRLVNNLVYGNSSNASTAGVGFLIFGGKPKIELINNTVVDNAGTLDGVSINNSDQFSIYAYNNIFFGNGGKDFAVDTGNQIVLVDNVIGTHSYPTPAQAPSGTTTGDPKLDSAHKPIESPPSPVINTGTASVIGGLPANDISGRARVVGSEPDRGAYESSISDAVLQSVTNTNDSGPGSLRAAILSANAGTGTGIFFNLPSCPSTIAPVTALPAITAPIIFVGYSQTGSSRNTLSTGDDAVICVILDGTPHNLADGLYVPPNASSATSVSVDGMAFSGFAHGAVSLYGGSGHTVTGSHIGGNVGGTNLDPVGTGIIVGPGVHDVTIGGDFEDYSLRNIIGSATGDAISIDGPNGSAGAAHDNQVIDNYIGVGWNPAGSGSFTNRGNGDAGIVVGGYNNDIERNYFEYNAGYGVDLTGVTAHDNNVEFNFIGYIGSFTDTGSGNGGGVVNENDAHGNAIEYNSIWFNAGTGVRIINGQNNIIYDNQLVGNGGLGIDLAGAGVTLNDNDSGAQTVDYANRGLNFPVITSATGGHTKGTISGTLTTIPGIYYLQFYVSPSCNVSGYGEGQFYFAATQVQVNGPTINGQATAAFSVVDSSSIGFAGYPIVTAVATDGNNNTSEFSQCFTYHDDTVFADGFGD
jgi:Right handed beta helix region